MTDAIELININLLKQADQLQVWRKSANPEMNIDSIWFEVQSLRKSEHRQLRKKIRVRRFLEALILDLWVSATHTDNPWRAISRNRNAYQKETRYRKLFFKFDLFIPLLDDLIDLGYIQQKIGFWNAEQGRGRLTRIRATDKLLSTCQDWGINYLVRANDVPEDEVVILKDADGSLKDYIDTAFTQMYRNGLRRINQLLENANLTIDGVKADTTRKRLYRIWNDGKWTQGGRYYGGFWQGLSQRRLKQREKIRINGEEVTELDYKCTHPSMLYAMENLTIPEDSYIVDGVSRLDVKAAFLVILNCKDRKQALDAMRHEKEIKNAKSVLKAIEEQHSSVSHKFYQRETGLGLQQLDSILADHVMTDLYKKNIVALPIHDSFIVARRHEDELRRSMNYWFNYMFNQQPKIDKKY